jgi:hypothetical protein
MDIVGFVAFYQVGRKKGKQLGCYHFSSEYWNSRGRRRTYLMTFAYIYSHWTLEK